MSKQGSGLSLPPGFRRRTALRHGVTVRQLQGPQFERIAYGIYLRRGHDTDELIELRALLATLPGGSAVSYTSALRLLGCPIPQQLRDDRSLHVTVPQGCPYPKLSTITAHSHIMAADDLMTVNGLLVTTGQRLFLDLSAVLSRESLVVIGDALIRDGWATVDGLVARTAAAHRRRGVRLARSTAPILDGRAQSPPESVIRVRIIDGGLPIPEPQCPIITSTGQVLAHVDLGWKKWRVAAEYEGRQHADGDQFGYDIARYTAIGAEGWIVLRAGRCDLEDGSHRFLAHLRNTLRSRGAPC